MMRVLLLLAALLAGPAPQARLTDAEAVVPGASTATGSAYTFSTTWNGRPVRYDPCTTIHWQFRSAGAPTSGLTVVKQSVAAVAQATGTTWVFDGVVATTPTSSWLPRTAVSRPVLIGWTDAAHSDLLRGQPALVLAVTRNSWLPSGTQGQTLTSVIALDSTERMNVTGPRSWRTVVLHELGHAMGLGHAGSSAQLLHAQLSNTLTGFQSGDLAGLRRLGIAAGCV